MKILICSIMPQGAYSGGRYHAWMMAQAFAALGHQVTFWTNNTPIFIDDFEDFDFGDRFVLRLTRDFSDTPDGPWDFVWIIPHKHPPVKVFRRALDISVANKAKLGMLSFETPNWIAKTAEHGTNQKPWDAWKAIGPHLDVVLASTLEGETHAEEYFAGTGARFHHINPPINDLAAAEAKSLAVKSEDRRSVICITRFGGAFGYKGGMELLDHAGPALSGCRLTFIVGTATMDESVASAYHTWGEEHDVEVRFQHRVTDVEKFKLLYEADLMLFLSRFEGFGYPPVEALYCGVPCVVYDLPVLREVSGDKLIYASMDEPEELAPIISDVLYNLPARQSEIRQHDYSSLGFDAYVRLIDDLLGREAEYAPKANVTSEDELQATRKTLVAIDQATRKPVARRGTPSLKHRVKQNFVRLLAGTFRRVPVLRKLFGQAILSHHNLSLLLEDRAMAKLMFENRKALTLAIRRNPGFLKHLMLSPQAQELLPEVLARLREKEAISVSQIAAVVQETKNS